MKWQLRSDLPIHTQLVQQLTCAILSGSFAPGERLPAVRELAAQAEVNPNTMQRALTQLESTGLIYTQRTAGRFVTGDGGVIVRARQALAAERLEEFLRAMAELGYDTAQVQQLLAQQGGKQ